MSEATVVQPLAKWPWRVLLVWLALSVVLSFMSVLHNQPFWIGMLIMLNFMAAIVINAVYAMVRLQYKEEQSWQASLDQPLVQAKVTAIRLELHGVPDDERREILRRARQKV